jgi:hypothetical protein
MSVNVRKRKHATIFLISIMVLCLCIMGCSVKPYLAEEADDPVKPLPIEQAEGGKIDVSVSGNMKIVRSGFDPDTTIEELIETIPSIDIDDERQILAIINGQKYISDTPACASDLYIFSDNNSFLIHTECGSIIATIDDRTMSCILSDTECEELLRICDAY